VKDNVYIWGAATTPMWRRDVSVEEIAHEVVADALYDAGVSASDVDLVVFGNATAGRLLDQACIRGQSFLLEAGLRNAGVVNVDNSCASGASALHLGTLATAGGAGLVLAVGVEKMWTGDRKETLAGIEDGVPIADREYMHSEWENPSGSVLMALNSMWALEHMAYYGTTAEMVAACVVKARHFGSLNPHAQYRDVVSIHEVLASPVVVPPLTRLMCSSFTDGGAAVVLSDTKRTGAPRILASVSKSGNGELDYHERLAEASQAAFAQARVVPGDIDVAEIHDATAPEELFALEALGFFAPGEAGPATLDGRTGLDTPGLVVNTSGGLVARGHPLGATGIAQVVELVGQLRDQNTERQVGGAQLALAANTGGMVGTHNGVTDAAFIGIHILERG
jgi:acetyl-CoA acyltransferase